jgi:hypothetical protein
MSEFQPDLRRLSKREDVARASSVLTGVTGERLRALEAGAFPSSLLLSLTAEQECSRKKPPSVLDIPRDHKLESVKEVLKKFVQDGVQLPRTELHRNLLINETLVKLHRLTVSAQTIRC